MNSIKRKFKLSGNIQMLHRNVTLHKKRGRRKLEQNSQNFFIHRQHFYFKVTQLLYKPHHKSLEIKINYRFYSFNELWDIIHSSIHDSITKKLSTGRRSISETSWTFLFFLFHFSNRQSFQRRFFSSVSWVPSRRDENRQWNRKFSLPWNDLTFCLLARRFMFIHTRSSSKWTQPFVY